MSTSKIEDDTDEIDHKKKFDSFVVFVYCKKKIDTI